ncbi:Uncharacterised protein [Serratia quinivorans]|uniref:DUF4238 domain-containing protein n=1 Tax=Serratia quinivorans TaxID=137545 RepID=UPI0021786B57|nr:DUF4238 domain-containing protein [Serratia quinivorans]CAI1722105.1 Uncharacterised protein [Serratia quinivorans]
MKKLKTERHHWWPRCVSKHWANDEGFTNRLTPDLATNKIPPAQLGMIGNGHHIKLSRIPGEPSPWDQSFEKTFDLADNNFPKVIEWMNNLSRKDLPNLQLTERFQAHHSTEEQLKILTECVVSLVIRSPRNREASVSVAEWLRGAIPKAEREGIIVLNMRDTQRMVSDHIGSSGKFAVLFSTEKEFIFGDGFYHSFTAPANPPISPMILAPITPNISVIIYRPTSYSVEPRLSTLVLNDEEVTMCNHAVQVYSCNNIFFKSEMPLIKDDAFTCGTHCQYDIFDNPVEQLIRSIPGAHLHNGFNFLF